MLSLRLLIIFLLGFSSGLPFMLLGATLQAWYAHANLSVATVSCLSLISFPYVYRTIWGPLVDNFTLTRLGLRKSWIFSMQVLLFIGFNLLSCMNPNNNPLAMAIFAVALATISATQDIAIDAQRIEYIPQTHYASAAFLATLGYRLAFIVTGGLAFIMAEHLSWPIIYRIMACCFIPGMLAILFSSEPLHIPKPKSSLKAWLLDPFIALVRRKNSLILLAFIFFFKLGEAFTTTASGVVMPFLIQGMHYSLKEIGYITNTLGLVALICGGFVISIILRRWSLYICLMIIGVMQALANLLFVLVAVSAQNLYFLSLAVVSDNFLAGMGTTALVTFCMKIVDKRYTGTQFSILVAVATLPRVISGPIAAFFQAQIGWSGLFQLSAIIALVFVPFLWKVAEEKSL